MLALGLLTLATPSAQAHDQQDWYPWKWNLSEVGSNIKWGFMPDWFNNSAYEARTQNAANAWTALGGNRDLNQRNDWGSNWDPTACSSEQEKNGIRRGNLANNSWLAVTYRCPDNHGHLWSANIKVADDKPFYTGTGSPPSDEFDYWSVIEHEFGHLLGFSPHWDSTGAVNICDYSNPPYHLMCAGISKGLVLGVKDHEQHTFNAAY
jgi:hypothetical protein